MDIKVIYIGNDIQYWGKLRNRFEKNYEALSFKFDQISTDEGYIAYDVFALIYEAKPEIVYLDFSHEAEVGLLLSKWLTRNNETRLISLVGLHSIRQPEEILLRALKASVRLNHIKSSEIQDVIYDPISLLDVNMATMPEFVRSNGIEGVEILQPLRIAYIEENKFHIETNSYLNVGEIVGVDNHPLSNVMPSCKVYVENFYDTNLYYNMRFGYDLEFIYIDNDFFAATNERWKFYKKIKEEETPLEDIEDMDEIEKREILEDMNKRKEIYAPTKKAIKEWMVKFKNRITPKKLKVMVVDDTLEILNELKSSVEQFPHTLNLQTVLLNNFYQVQRTMPHLIVLRISEKNNRELISNLIKKIKTIEDYEPYILMFGTEESTESIRQKDGYEKILSRTESINLSQIKDIASKLDAKVAIVENEGKVFFNSADKESTMFLKRKVKVLGMTESVLYFESNTEVPMWTTFMVKKPIKMLLTVVPHKDGGYFSKTENCYRCLINGVGESDKAEIRKLINLTLIEEEKEEKND